MWFLENQNYTEAITYVGPKIWSIIPGEKRESASLKTFCQSYGSYGNHKLWKPNSCPCCICCIANVDLVNLS